MWIGLGIGFVVGCIVGAAIAANNADKTKEVERKAEKGVADLKQKIEERGAQFGIGGPPRK